MTQDSTLLNIKRNEEPKITATVRTYPKTYPNGTTTPVYQGIIKATSNVRDNGMAWDEIINSYQVDRDGFGMRLLEGKYEATGGDTIAKADLNIKDGKVMLQHYAYQGDSVKPDITLDKTAPISNALQKQILTNFIAPMTDNNISQGEAKRMNQTAEYIGNAMKNDGVIDATESKEIIKLLKTISDPAVKTNAPAAAKKKANGR